jgi:hypothetical protein
LKHFETTQQLLVAWAYDLWLLRVFLRCVMTSISCSLGLKITLWWSKEFANWKPWPMKTDDKHDLVGGFNTS